MTSTPVALFVYNRPWHTQRTVEALQANRGANDTKLHIFSDAPLSPRDESDVMAVRRYLRNITGFKKVHCTFREKNMGLANSITEGVSHLCEEYGRTIVLEDDLVTSPYFLQFMNNALDCYENDENVMHVSGFAYPTRSSAVTPTFFFRVPLCWGWATWSRAWKTFRRDISVIDLFNDDMINKLNVGGSYDFWKQILQNRDGTRNTWFIFWYVSVFLEGGLALFPSKSLVRNIGHDGTGVHCSRSLDYDVNLAESPVEVTWMPPLESPDVVKLHEDYFKSLKPKLIRRVIRRAKMVWSDIMPRKEGATR